MTTYKKAENNPLRTDEYPRTILIVGLGNVRVVIGDQPESRSAENMLSTFKALKETDKVSDERNKAFFDINKERNY